MLSVLYSEYELWGCPNCGCDSVISSGGGLTSGTCRHCKLKFEVRSENPMGIVQYGCHNHEFDEILEVHHLKGILEFDKDTLIKEINDEANLVWLCPNHHIMLEKGLISLD